MARIVGGKKLNNHLRSRSKRMDVTDILLRGAERIRAEYIDMVNEPSPGSPQVRYSKGREPRTVIAAAPGNPPNTDTGSLVGSVTTRVVRTNQVELSVEAAYAGWLEFGTDKMAPRPALVPASEYIKPFVLANLRKAYRNG